MRSNSIPLLLFLLLCSVSVFYSPAQAYHELYRPGYHYSPPKNWMNDPNGLVFFHGVYHMYYQYNPYGTDHYNMSWGHAVSLDLVYWENLPIGIPMYNDTQIYSGSIIIDVNNTSGFCLSKALGCMLAFYTAQNATNEVQSVAYSNDFGLTFTQYANNPLIDENQTDHRDPKVFWYEPQQKWIMITALSFYFKVRLYESKDLTTWTHLSDFGPEGSTEGAWEDPDLFLITVEGETTQKWVLTHAVNVAKVEYYIGEFDGTNFTNTETANETLFFDYGNDFDEASTWNNEPRGRRLIIAWFDEGEYGGQLPERVWRGQQTLVRELKLRRYPEGLRMVSEPIEEYKKLRYNPIHYDDVQLNSSTPLITLNTTGNQLEIIAEIAYPNDTTHGIPTEFGFKVFVGDNQTTWIGYNVTSQLLFVNRENSGIVDFDPFFADITNQTLTPENGTIQLRIFIDQCTTEVFANNGKVAMSNLVFPDPTQNKVQVYAVGGSVNITSIDIWQLKDIWPNKTAVADEDEGFLSVLSQGLLL